MNSLFILAWIWTAFIAMAFWESSVEGRNCWDKGKYGWKLKIGGYVVLTRYHFFLFYVMMPLLLTLPLIIYGWNFQLFGIIATGFFSGVVIEDIVWYAVNPKVKFSEINTKFDDYVPKISIGKAKVSVYYILSLLVAFLFWYFT